MLPCKKIKLNTSLFYNICIFLFHRFQKEIILRQQLSHIKAVIGGQTFNFFHLEMLENFLAHCLHLRIMRHNEIADAIQLAHRAQKNLEGHLFRIGLVYIQKNLCAKQKIVL